MSDPLKIIEFHAENTKRLKAVTIRPDAEQPVVVLTGKNRQGKTSVLDAIWFALGGKSSIPSQPIRAGEKEAVATIDLGEFIVERRITEKGTYLNVTTRDGFKATSAQTFLSERLGDRAQNPLEFMRLGPTDQVTALQGMVNLKLPVEEFEEISGLKIPAGGFKNMDPVTVLDNAYKHLYEKRTDINKELKRLEGAIKTLSADIPPGKDNLQAVSATELFSVRKALEARKADNDKQRQAVARDEAKLIDMQQLLTDIHNERLDIQARLVKLQEQWESLHEEYQQMEGELSASRIALDQLEDPDFSDIDARIAAADETNRIANLLKSRLDSMAELDQVSSRSADLTSRLAGIKDLKGRLVAEAGLPVPGLGFSNGEVTYNDIPLSQASGREQIEISCAVCMARHPAIGILTIDVGWSELDSEGKDVIRKWAQQVGAQIWVTKVTDDPEQEGFHIHDGELAAVNGEPVPAGGNGDNRPDEFGTKPKGGRTQKAKQAEKLEAPSWMQ
jgi:prefoldin subunit 5